jgi:hypothetical protein
VIRRGLIGAAAVTLVVLLARTLAYAAEPGPSARFLAQRAGGPALPVLAVVALTIGVVLALTICWLVAVAVRERALLERRAAEPFAVVRACALALALAAVTSIVGGLFEAYVHWRAGLGWHGLHCLVGPVHRDLLPLETALSFVAAAVISAARYVVVWMRRTFARLAAQLTPLPFVDMPSFARAGAFRARPLFGVLSARGPPSLG